MPPGKRQRIFQYFRGLFVKDSWKSIEKSDILFFSDDAHHTSLLNSLPFSPLLDNLAAGFENVGVRTQRVAFFGSRHKKVFGGTESLTLNRKYILVRLRDMICGLRNKEKVGEGVNMPNVTRFFSHLLTKSGAKIVISVGVPKPLATAAHNTNTGLIEVIHGFGYSSVPWDYIFRAPEELPDEVWVGDPLSLETFRQLSHQGVAVKLISPLQLEPPARISSSESAPDNFGARLGPSNIPRPSPGEPKKVVFATSRGGRFGERIDTNRFDWNIIESLISQSSESVLWFFRVHPTQISAGFSSAVFRKVTRITERYTNCDWKWMSRVPPSLTFSQMDSLLTFGGSEIVYDAHYAGLNSGVLLPNHLSPHEALGQNKTLDFLVERGSVSFLSTEIEEILRWILKQTKGNESARKEARAESLNQLVARVHKHVAESKSP